MRTIASWARNVLPVAAIAAAAAAAPRAQTNDVGFLLARIGARVADYYKRVQNIVCMEKSTVQPISMYFSSDGFARITESELRVESDALTDGDTPSEANIVRRILRVNGRPPRDKDKTDRAGCTDPNPLSPEPLAFLLPANQHEYKFSSAGFGKGKDSRLLMIDFVSPGTGKPGKLIEDPNGHEDCFDWSVSTTTKGRVWIDATTYDIVRLEEHFAGPVTLSVANDLQRKHNLPNWIVVDRYDRTIRLKVNRFKEPDEDMLLPESIETLILVRSGLQSTRRQQQFSDYRRFLTGGRIVKN
jgi:hypothetical protein